MINQVGFFFLPQQLLKELETLQKKQAQCTDHKLLIRQILALNPAEFRTYLEYSHSLTHDMDSESGINKLKCDILRLKM